MRRSIFLKIFGGYLLVTLILAGLILAFSFAGIREFYIESATRDLRNLGVALETSTTPLVRERKYQELDALVKRIGKEIKTRITIISPDGRVFADSEADPETMENHRTRTEVAQALEGKVGRFLRVSGTLKEEMLYVALPLKTGNVTIGVVRMSLFLKEMNQALYALKQKILLITVVILCISLLFAMFFSKSLSRPIRELSEASRRVAGQDFNVRVLLRNRDELKDLADSFNSMVAQIRALFAELTHQKGELTSIISSLQEGLLVLDRDDRVLLCNESFKRIVSDGHMEGKFFWEIFREPRFDEMIRKVRSTRRNLMEEIEFRQKVYLCSATFLESEGEIAMVFHDITQIKNLERIKTDFVLNVSHELRTPLTAIKGFAETLQEVTKDEEAGHYVAIISRNTDRLINIINDLLSISELGSRDVEREFTEVDLRNLVEHVIKTFSQRVGQKNLYLKLTSDEDLPRIKADPFRLEQMFINLIDNAVKYSEKGGIDITLKPDKQGVSIAVKDTGIGIPQEHLTRIFERFYVVDKSRSKKMGGTGLGLSIVKHVVMMHKGTIDVESTVGVGSTFTVTLPLDPLEQG
jgi:two-component system, OmpR family, phosphate regulon sensor histidine kinase PhoR